MAVIEDVAREAGVSVATVSRVLNKSEKVAEKTKNKVQRAIKKLNYEPNMLGRNLRRSQSMVIIALIPNISNPFYNNIVHGIEDLARKKGYNMLLCQTYSNEERKRIYINLLKHKLADGLISMDPTLDVELLRELETKYPIVQCCEYTEELDIPYVTIDNFKAGYEAAKHLISMGKKRIALINSDEKFLYARQRRMGYEKALEEAGLKNENHYIENCSLDFQCGEKGMKKLLHKKEKPDGVFVVSDVLAIGALKAMKDQGVKVPEEVALVGFDDISFAAMTNPSLTTMAQPMYELGSEACSMLIQRIKDKAKPVKNRILDFKLVVRESTTKK